MIKLRAIIDQMDPEDYGTLENLLIQNKADNFLLLLRRYKEKELNDNAIIEELNSNVNSFHTLKSRLYDKIQMHLMENHSGNKSDMLSQLANIPMYCYNTPRETAEAILHKLEQDLKTHDMSGDLISVYSALKKINLYSPKYYEYSQLYNKHLAYTMALEKAEELLGSFIRTLSQYYLSRSPGLLEMMILIKKETKNIFQLNKSPHIEVILNIIIIHLQLFTNYKPDNNEATDDLLDNTEKIIQKFPNNIHYKTYGLILSFLRYEYYIIINEHKKAQGYFNEVNNSVKTWLLLDNSCLSYKFLFSKINNYCRRNIETSLDSENEAEAHIFDPKNIHTSFNEKFYLALCKFYAAKYRESTTIINSLLNSISFKDLLHAEIDVKLSLAYIYIKQKEYDLASGLLRSIYRKIKVQDNHKYENVIVFLKLLSLLMDFDGSEAMKSKILRAMRLFEFENTGETKILKFLEPELEKLKTDLV